MCASATSLPFGNGEFDGVVMIHILEHLADDEAESAVSEAARVLRSGGTVFVRSFSRDDMRSPAEGTEIKGNGVRYRYFTENEIKELFRGLSVVSLSTVRQTTKFGGVRSRVEGVFLKT